MKFVDRNGMEEYGRFWIAGADAVSVHVKVPLCSCAHARLKSCTHAVALAAGAAAAALLRMQEVQQTGAGCSAGLCSFVPSSDAVAR